MSELKEWPLVTYIVVSFNHVRFVRDAIEGILNQDYPAIELIVVDDGSTDGSAELLRVLSAERNFKLVEKRNGGVVSSVNCAIPMASGEFVVIHASDDISHASRTREQVSVLLSDPGAGFTVGGIRKISEFGDVISPHVPTMRRTYRFDDFRRGQARAIAVSCLYRAEAIKGVVPLDESIVFEDVQLYWRVTAQGWSCVYADDILSVDYRIIHGSLGRRNKIKLAMDFRKFLDRYACEEWYREAIARANSGVFVQLAIDRKAFAVVFLVRNFANMSLPRMFRGLALIFVPRWLIYKIRAKY